MTLRIALSLVVSFLIGWLTLALIWRSVPDTTPWQRARRLCLAFGVGHGITSCVAFVFLLVAGSVSEVYFVTEVVVLAALGALYSTRKKREGPPLERAADEVPYTRPVALLAAAFYASAALALTTVALRLARWPHGGYDAWTIWNLRARAIFRSGEAWRENFSGFVLHPDYPLLLPLSVVRGWMYAGTESTLVPALLAWLFMAATIGLVTSAVGALAGRVYGYVAGILLLGYGYFVLHASTELAELPLMFFFLAALVLTAIHSEAPRTQRNGALVAAGLAAGLAAWTKNEGLLFVAAFAIAHFVVIARTSGPKAAVGQVMSLAIGMVPVLAVVLYFKSHFAPPNVWLADMATPRALSFMGELERYLLILKEFARRFFYYSGFGINTVYVLAAFLICVGVTRRNKVAFGHAALTLAAMIVGLMSVYLTAKPNIGTFIGGSLDRVLVELWPAFIFSFFLVAAPPAHGRLDARAARGSGSG